MVRVNFFAERLDFNILELAKKKPPPPWGVWRETPVRARLAIAHARLQQYVQDYREDGSA